MTGIAKERLSQSKRARSGSLAIVDKPQVAQTCILRVDVVLSFSGVTFVLFCFRFRLFLCFLSKPRPFIESFLNNMHAPRQHTQLPNNCRCPSSFCFVSFCFFGGVAFFPPSILYHCRFFFVWRVMYVFVPAIVPGSVFLPCDQGLDFGISFY